MIRRNVTNVGELDIVRRIEDRRKVEEKTAKDESTSLGKVRMDVFRGGPWQIESPRNASPHAPRQGLTNAHERETRQDVYN